MISRKFRNIIGTRHGLSTALTIAFIMQASEPSSQSLAYSPLRDSARDTNPAHQFFTDLFSAVALDNFGASFSAALSDNLTWTVTGSSPIAGTYHPKSTYISQVLTPLRQVLVTLPVPIVDHIFIDGDWGVVNWHSEGVRGKNGADYDMQYCWLMRVDWEDGGSSEGKVLKIEEVKGFYDGQKVAAVFEGYDLEQLRGGM